MCDAVCVRCVTSPLWPRRTKTPRCPAWPWSLSTDCCGSTSSGSSVRATLSLRGEEPSHTLAHTHTPLPPRGNDPCSCVLQSSPQHRVSSVPQGLPQCGAQRHPPQHLRQDHPVHRSGTRGQGSLGHRLFESEGQDLVSMCGFRGFVRIIQIGRAHV